MTGEVPQGKVTPEVFARDLAPHLGAARAEVVVGPRVGHDAAIVRVGAGRVLAMTTDPLTIIPCLGIERSARLAAHLVASDLWTTGIPPAYASVTLNLSPTFDDDALARWQRAMSEAWTELGVAVVTGHTGRLAGCSDQVIGAATLVGVGDEGRYVTPGMARVGDRIVVTKSAAFETAALAAWLCPERVRERVADDDAFERRLFVIRKRFEKAMERSTVAGSEYCYFPSLSSRTLVYKGMLTPPQLTRYFLDLDDPRMVSAIAMFHSRFSTNTFPSWKLAHPYRFIAHNGEINTVRGNRNWMAAREALLASNLIPGDISRLFPIVDPHGSDSASFDEVLELLYLGGRSLPHSILMMIPEAWENHESMAENRKDFYRFHASLMEPWDGPACVTFTDGNQIGAVLDRNGLRPSRFWVTDDGLVILSSEVGVLEIDQAKIIRKGRLQPGRMFLVDISEGRIIEDDEIKDSDRKSTRLNSSHRT